MQSLMVSQRYIDIIKVDWLNLFFDQNKKQYGNRQEVRFIDLDTKSCNDFIEFFNISTRNEKNVSFLPTDRLMLVYHKYPKAFFMHELDDNEPNLPKQVYAEAEIIYQKGLSDIKLEEGSTVFLHSLVKSVTNGEIGIRLIIANNDGFYL